LEPLIRIVAQKYFEFFKAYDLSDKEIIWGKLYRKDIGNLNSINRQNANNGNECYGSHSPTQNFVDDYQMEDGSKFFDHFYIDGENYYKNNSASFTNVNPYYNREPRFYGSVLYDSAVWQPRVYASLGAIDPVGIYDRRTRKTVNLDGTSVIRYGLDTQKGPVSNWNGSLTGYIMKKLLDDKCNGYFESNQNVWIEIRYAEIILNYAEACLELGDELTAATYINLIRNRAGLPDFQGDIEEALRYERKVELAFEDRRWFDIRRWTILEQVLTNAKGIDILEVKQDNAITTTWQQINAQNRGPVTKKLYWIPIPKDEILRAPQLEQNPNY
jgi:hypothetical protein